MSKPGRHNSGKPKCHFCIHKRGPRALGKRKAACMCACHNAVREAA